MKKIIIVLLFLVSATSICLCLINIFLRPSTIAHENLIPDNTAAVAILDVEAMIKESGIKLEPKKMQKMDMGIEFRKPIYAYLTESAYFGVAAALSDYKALEKNFDEVRRIDGFTWGTMDGLLVCHDNNRVLVFGPNLSWEDKKAQKEMVGLMNKQVTTSILFENLRKQDGALRAKISLEKVASLFAKDAMQDVKKEMQKRLSDYAGTDAEVDVATLTVDIVGKATSNSFALKASLTSRDKKTNDILQKLKNSLRPLSHELDAHIPQNPTLWMCMNIDGPVVYSTLMKDKEMASQMNMIEQFINVGAILGSVNGDVLLVLGDVTQRNMEMGMAVQVDNTKFLTSTLMQSLGLLEIRVGEYESKSNKSVYLTNTSLMEQNMSSGGFQTDKADGYNDGCVFYLSVNANKAMQAVKPIVSISEEITTICAFLAQDVDRMNLRATQDMVECKWILNSTINDYVSKWIE
ncbi:MAG: DUF4836 family protein [Paraprevotella sp.]|nr:DUF4836 family protein [Paraprevotella sp.]